MGARLLTYTEYEAYIVHINWVLGVHRRQKLGIRPTLNDITCSRRYSINLTSALKKRFFIWENCYLWWKFVEKSHEIIYTLTRDENIAQKMHMCYVYCIAGILNVDIRWPWKSVKHVDSYIYVVTKSQFMISCSGLYSVCMRLPLTTCLQCCREGFQGIHVDWG